MTDKMVSPRGEEHGLLNKIANSSTVPFQNMEPNKKEEIEKIKEDDGRMVKVRYVNHQDQENGKLDIHYCKYAGDPILFYRFLSGFEYTVPMGLVKQINNSKLVTRSEVLDKNGMPTRVDGKDKRVHEMVPTHF